MRSREIQLLRDAGFEFNGTIAVPLEVAAVDAEETSLEEFLSHETAPEFPVAGEKAQPSRSRTSRRDTVQIFNRDDVDTALRQLKSRLSDREQVRMFEARLKEMLNRGPDRKLPKASKARIRRLEALGRACPNFSEVVDFLITETRLAMVSKRPVYPTPILLLGDPGVGKSHFASLLSDVYQSDLVRVQIEQADTASVLSGTGQHWSNARTGIIFDALCDSKSNSAAPVLMLDEADKFVLRENGQSSIACLYSLLEEESAKQFRDACLSTIPLDARNIVWVATANDLSRLPEPICSRFRIFVIPQPTKTQARNIVQALYQETIASYRLPAGFDAFPEEALEALMSVSPRAARRMLREALGRALAEGADSLRKEHITSVDNVPATTPELRGTRIIYVIDDRQPEASPIPRERLH